MMYLLNYVTKKKLTLCNSFMILFSDLTGQGDHKDIRYYCKNINMINSSICISLFVIFLISSEVLSKAFTCLLLKTFFNMDFTPVVNSLQDIRDNKELLIGGNYRYISHIANVSNFDINDILARMNENLRYISGFGNIIEHIINGKGVLLYHTMMRKAIIDLAKFYNDKIYVSDHKYLPDFTSFLVHRERNSSKIIEF